MLLAAIAALVLSACGDDEEATTSAADAPECENVQQADPKQVNLKRPPLDRPPAGTRAVFETSCGAFEIELDTKRAPQIAHAKGALRRCLR